MGAAPLSWLAKIGGDTLKTKAKLLSSAINELHDDGQCKIVAVVDNTADNGKTVLITTDDNKTYSGTIANKKCAFLLPPKTLYTVQKVSSGSAEFTTKVEAGYGDCILVHLDAGYVEVKQGDIVGLDYIKAAEADNLKNKVPEANAIKELNSSLGGFTPVIDNTGKITGYKTNVGADTVFPFNSLQLVGTFSGNKTINVSSFLKNGDTVNNFIIEVTNIPATRTGLAHYATTVDAQGAVGWINSISPSKSLSGNNLITSGFVITVYGGKDDGNGVWVSVSKSANISYKVYHI